MNTHRVVSFWSVMGVLMAAFLVMNLGCMDWSGGDDDDDDDDDDASSAGNNDDDNGSDDDNKGDDDDDLSTCEDVYIYMYADCGWTFIDKYGGEISLDDVISWCESSEGGYGLEDELAECIVDSDCSEIPDCLE